MNIKNKIKSYNPNGGLITSTELFLALATDKHKLVRDHSIRLSLLAEKVAKENKKGC